MKVKNGVEAEWGDMEYFNKTQVCECCHRELPRFKFKQAYRNGTDEVRYRAMKICNDCRSIHKKVTGDVKWGGSHDQVSRPAIIDLMESYRED